MGRYYFYFDACIVKWKTAGLKGYSLFIHSSALGSMYWHIASYIYIYLHACSVWNSTEGFVSTGILVAVNGYILTTVDFVKRTLSDIKIVRGIKIADFVLKSFMVQVWVTAEFHRRCTCGKVKNSSRGFLCTFNCQISVLSFFNGKLFWNSNIISQQARIYCVSLSIALGDLCVLFILTNWSCMELIIAHCMKIRTC